MFNIHVTCIPSATVNYFPFYVPNRMLVYFVTNSFFFFYGYHYKHFELILAHRSPTGPHSVFLVSKDHFVSFFQTVTV